MRLRTALAWLLMAATGAAPLPAAVTAAPPPAAPEPGAVPPRIITLPEALAAADTANIDVVTARNAQRTAAAGLRSADTAPNPQFSFNTSQLRPNRIGNDRVELLSDSVFRLDVPLERGGKRRARVGAARAGLEAAGDDVLDTRRQVANAVTGAFYALVAAERRQTLLAGISESYAASLKLAERRQAAGALSGGDLARQRVDTLRAAAAAAQAVSDRREAQLALAVLTGREAEAARFVTGGDWPTVAAIAAEPADAIAERRPDVRAAVARVEAARRNLDGAHALRHPDITAGAQYQNAGRDLGIGSSVGIGFSVPLPVRNRYLGEVDAAGTALAQAEAQAEKTRAVAIAEIITARRAAAEAAARRASFEDAQLPAARKAAATSEFAYKSGALALTDLLDARRTLQAVELAAIDAHVDEANALARMRAAETNGDD